MIGIALDARYTTFCKYELAPAGTMKKRCGMQEPKCSSAEFECSRLDLRYDGGRLFNSSRFGVLNANGIGRPVVCTAGGSIPGPSACDDDDRGRPQRLLLRIAPLHNFAIPSPRVSTSLKLPQSEHWFPRVVTRAAHFICSQIHSPVTPLCSEYFSS